MGKVLITGGTGFVGYWMKQTQPRYVTGYYLSHKQYEEALWPIPDFYVHLAPVDPAHVIDFSRRYGGRILFASSGAVYHQKPNTYGLNKILWERECLNSEQNIVIARLFTFFGERLDDNKALTQFIKCARAGKPIRVWGDGNTVRSYMSGAEMGRWMWAILFGGQNGEAYDVGSDQPVTMLELARMVNATFGNRSPIILEFKPEHCTYYLPPDTAKTRRLL
jgi:nucleoside-diphosphate-sugar epimerase